MLAGNQADALPADESAGYTAALAEASF